MGLVLTPVCPAVQLSEKMRRQSLALRLSSSEIRRLALRKRDSAEEQAARHLLQVRPETGPHIALQGLPSEDPVLGSPSAAPCRVASNCVVVQEEEPKARQEARLIAMKERAEVAASLAEAQALQSMAEQPGSQMDQLTEEIARIKHAEQVSTCCESAPRGACKCRAGVFLELQVPSRPVRPMSDEPLRRPVGVLWMRGLPSSRRCRKVAPDPSHRWVRAMRQAPATGARSTFCRLGVCLTDRKTSSCTADDMLRQSFTASPAGNSCTAAL